MGELWRRSPRRWLELVTDVTNEEDMGTDSVRSVGLIKRVEKPICAEQAQKPSGKEMPQERAQAVRALWWEEQAER